MENDIIANCLWKDVPKDLQALIEEKCELKDEFSKPCKEDLILFVRFAYCATCVDFVYKILIQRYGKRHTESYSNGHDTCFPNVLICKTCETSFKRSKIRLTKSPPEKANDAYHKKVLTGKIVPYKVYEIPQRT